MSGINSGNRRRARQCDPHRVGDRRHGGRGAHCHTGASRPRDAALNALPFLIIDIARTAFVPVFPCVRTGTQNLAGIVAAQHRTRGQIDQRHPGRDCAHHQTRRCLVTAAHQHHAVQRVRADHFFSLHRQQIAVKHRGWFGVAFINRQRRHFDANAACHQNAALDVLDAFTKVRMAGVQFGPGVQDSNHRAVTEFFFGIAKLHHPGTVSKAAQIVL